jgi:hypothetical protein
LFSGGSILPLTCTAAVGAGIPDAHRAGTENCSSGIIKQRRTSSTITGTYEQDERRSITQQQGKQESHNNKSVLYSLEHTDLYIYIYIYDFEYI